MPYHLIFLVVLCAFALISPEKFGSMVDGFTTINSTLCRVSPIIKTDIGESEDGDSSLSFCGPLVGLDKSLGTSLK